MKQHFDFENELRFVLSDGKDVPCIFDRLLKRFEDHASRPASSIHEIKRRDNRKAKGDGWETFCQWYLLNVAGYSEVWFWNQVPENVRQARQLGSRVDNGIDLVARKFDLSGNEYWTAVQCKYRKDLHKTITWNQLSTFVGLCALTGPWDEHLVMTNCRGVSRKTGIPRGPKDRTMAYGTFKKITRTMCSGSEAQQTDGNEKIDSESLSAEDVRQARLAKFAGVGIASQ